MADKKYLDEQGLAKLWELINDTFLDETTYELDIEDLKAEYDAKIQEVEDKTDSELGDKVTALEEALALQKTETEQAIEDKFAEVVDGAPEAFDTLKELADYVQADDSRTLDIIQRIVQLEALKPLTEAEVEEICSRVAITTKVASAEDFTAALAQSGIIKLEDDIALPAALTIPAGEKVEIDLGGHNLTSTVTGTNSAFVANGSDLVFSGDGSVSAAGRIALAANGGSVTVEDGLIKSNSEVALRADGEGSKIVINGGTVESQEGSVLVTAKAAVEVNGGKLETFDNFAVCGNGIAGQGDVNIVINGGELISNIQSAGYVACGIYMPNSGTLTINGGTIKANGGAGVVCRGGLTTINGGEIIATAHPTLTVGKVGDSRQVVPCSAVVYDKNSKYPAMDTLEVIVGVNANLQSATENDIAIISDEAEPKVTDLRA